MENEEIDVVVRTLWTAKEGYVSVNTTSRSDNWSKGLSPFFNGPVKINGEVAFNVENAYQGSKVYAQHLDDNGEIKDEYYKWRQSIYKTKQALRYPLGKKEKPLFIFVDGNRYDYCEGKEKVYVPLYSDAVVLSEAFETLVDFVYCHKKVCLLDFDAYDHTGLTKNEIIYNPKKKFGHAFCLMWLLQEIFEIKTE